MYSLIILYSCAIFAGFMFKTGSSGNMLVMADSLGGRFRSFCVLLIELVDSVLSQVRSTRPTSTWGS